MDEPLEFLVGSWAGSGEWGGKPFTCRTVVDSDLRMRVRASQVGRPAHDEQVVFGTDERGASIATVHAAHGSPQVFAVQELSPGAAYRLAFTPPAGSALSPQRWTIRRTEQGYDETFEVAPGGGEFETAVTCSYVRDSEAAVALAGADASADASPDPASGDARGEAPSRP